MSRLAFTALVMSTLLWVGCGKKDKTTKTGSNGKTESKTKSKSKTEVVKKKPKTKPLKDKVIGKWKSQVELDDAKITKMLKDMGVKEADIPAALGKTKQALAGIGIVSEMRADGTYTVTGTGFGPEPKVSTGKWEVLSEDGNVLKLKSTENKKDARTETITLTFRGDDELTYETDDSDFNKAPFKSPVTFKRVKE